MKINSLMRELYSYVEDKEKYQKCIRRGRKLYHQIYQR